MGRDSGIARGAWNMLRLALLWARRGSVFRRRLTVKLQLAVAKFAKSIGSGRGYRSSTALDRICYGEHELSFDETPVCHVKMHRPGRSMRPHLPLPRIPCINPDVNFDCAFDDDDDDGEEVGECKWERKSLVAAGEREVCLYDEKAPGLSEEGIDERAEEFIAKFHEQIKLQRQISYLEYTEMLNRATS